MIDFAGLASCAVRIVPRGHECAIVYDLPLALGGGCREWTRYPNREAARRDRPIVVDYVAALLRTITA